MKDKSKSAYGTAFFIRMGVLLLVLAIVGGGMAYDRFVLLPAGEEAVERMMKAGTAVDAERVAIYEAAGRDPDEIEKTAKHSIEDWEFGRLLPGVTGAKVTVVFIGDDVKEIYSGGIPEKAREALQ